MKRSKRIILPACTAASNDIHSSAIIFEDTSPDAPSQHPKITLSSLSI